MPTLIEQPTRVAAAGNKPKLIDEFVGRVNTGEANLDRADARPEGWAEPGQTPEFDEITVVLGGCGSSIRAARSTFIGPADSPTVASGCVTAHPSPKGPSTSRSACRHFHSKPFTVMITWTPKAAGGVQMPGKVCLVTGATSGIGLVTARELALEASTSSSWADLRNDAPGAG